MITSVDSEVFRYCTISFNYDFSLRSRKQCMWANTHIFIYIYTFFKLPDRGGGKYHIISNITRPFTIKTTKIPTTNAIEPPDETVVLKKS